MNKKALYESIMKQVSKEVKKALSEGHSELAEPMEQIPLTENMPENLLYYLDNSLRFIIDKWKENPDEVSGEMNAYVGDCWPVDLHTLENTYEIVEEMLDHNHEPQWLTR